MPNDTENQEKVDKIRRLIDEARKARDTDTVKALGETMFELTGVKEPEFAAVEPSGNPDLDKLRKHLVDAIAARDEETEATLREMIKKEEGEKLPEVVVELTAEEPEAVENPFDPLAYTDEEAELLDPDEPEELTPFVAEDYEDDEPLEPAPARYRSDVGDCPVCDPVATGELTDNTDSRIDPPDPSEVEPVACDPEIVGIGEFLKDALGATQIVALRKAGLPTEGHLRERFCMSKDPKQMLIDIKGIGESSANAIMEALGYEA